MRCCNCPLCEIVYDPVNDFKERYCLVTGLATTRVNSCSRTNKFILSQDREKLITDWQVKAEKIADYILKEIEVKLYDLFKNMDN